MLYFEFRLLLVQVRVLVQAQGRDPGNSQFHQPDYLGWFVSLALVWG